VPQQYLPVQLWRVIIIIMYMVFCCYMQCSQSGPRRRASSFHSLETILEVLCHPITISAPITYQDCRELKPGLKLLPAWELSFASQSPSPYLPPFPSPLQSEARRSESPLSCPHQYQWSEAEPHKHICVISWAQVYVWWQQFYSEAICTGQ